MDKKNLRFIAESSALLAAGVIAGALIVGLFSGIGMLLIDRLHDSFKLGEEFLIVACVISCFLTAYFLMRETKETTKNNALIPLKYLKFLKPEYCWPLITLGLLIVELYMKSVLLR